MTTNYRWLTPLSQEFLDRDYLVGETVDQRVDVICNTAERILNKPGFAARFKEYFSRGWYSFSTPIWNNFGNNRGAGISCFGTNIEDNMESIAEAWSEIFMMTKGGGGTSAYFGKVRHRGAPIKNNGVSSGSVHFMHAFDNLINIASQGQSRRGNCAVYLDIDHPDILEFLRIRTEGHPIQDLSFGVCVPDYWMREMIDGDKEKREVWAKVLQARASVGYPYIFFVDNANNGTVDCYKDKGMRINHTNLCVTGDQRVVSNRGMKTARQLWQEGGNLELFDNNKMVSACPMQLIEKNADVYKITLENGMSHTITKYHKVMTSEYDNCHKEVSTIKKCEDLKIGDRVAIQTAKGLFGNKNMKNEAFLLGLYQADGTQYKDYVAIDIWEKDFDLIEEIQTKFNHIHNEYGCDRYMISNQNGISTKTRKRKPAQFLTCVVAQSKVSKKRLMSKTLKKALNFKKGFVPQWIWEADEETQWQYIRGLLYADGTVFVSESKGNPLQISLSNINKEFLQEVQLIYANLGLQSSIRLMREAGETLLPDGKGSKKLYKTKDCWRLIIGNKNDALTLEKHTKFLSRKGIHLEDREYRDNTKKFYKIQSIEYVGKEDVFCTKVDSDEHLWICNGFVTHNCVEIMLPNNKDESFVCDLSSMNDLYFDEWKDTDAVELLVYFLDAVMTEFIEKASKVKFMHRAVRFAERHRALGIGQFGWHSYLQSKMIPFESMEAKMLNVQIAKTIQEKAWQASRKMAQEYGEPEVLKGYGRRHTTLTAIAPTKSSAWIIGQASESNEPNRTNYLIKDLQKGKYTVKNPYLEILLESKGKNDAATWDDILKHGGSVQHLDFLTEHEKAVFRTFAEISQKEVIILASQRQKYVDQGQSLNLMIHPSIPIKDVNALYIEAWRLKIKSLYYQYSVNAAQSFTRNILSCSSCE